MKYENSLTFARQQDRQDPLGSFRNRFHIPIYEGKEVIYFCGNSLGLQPKEVSQYLQKELDSWARRGVEGHFEGENPWYSYHHLFEVPLAHILGATPLEVVAMNSLTANLHFLLASFYQPTEKRFKILTEARAFPSDLYALKSQIDFHNFPPQEALVEVSPPPGEVIIPTEKILAAIEDLGDELALVMMGGVNYYSGQAFEMDKITAKAHEVGAKVGFDLAHGAGNLNLHLHDWEVDFAAWCSYKYLNSGPGGVGGIFVHEKYSQNRELPRLEGWWGHREETRFDMPREFDPAPGAQAWQLSNAPVLAMAAHKASLDLFEEAGMEALGKKRDHLTGYLDFLLRDLLSERPEIPLQIITPSDPSHRGCQLSLFITEGGQELYRALKAQGVVMDWRKPDVIRVAPVPLYNRYQDVWLFVDMIRNYYNSTS